MQLWVLACGTLGREMVICSSVQLVCWILHVGFRSDKRVLFFISAVLMAEIAKLVTCLVLVFYEEGKDAEKFGRALHNTIINNPVDTMKICVPSVVYLIQNNLLYLSASHLDAATYQVSDTARAHFENVPKQLNLFAGQLPAEDPDHCHVRCHHSPKEAAFNAMGLLADSRGGHRARPISKF